MTFQNWFRPSPGNHTIARSRNRVSKRTRRFRPAMEHLEDRVVPSALLINDVTVREGPTSLGVLDSSGAVSVGLDGTRGIRFSSNGDLFVTGSHSNTVARFDWASQTYQPFVSSGGGGLNAPFGVAIGPDSNVYVSAADQQNNLAPGILRYDGTTGAPLPAPGRPGAVFVEDDPNTSNVDESGGLGGPGGLDFGADGNLYVASGKPTAHTVLRYQGPGGPSPGAFMDVFVNITDMAQGPNQVLFGPDGNLYVDGGGSGDHINRYDGSTGAPIGNGVFVAAGGFQGARQMVIDPQGNFLYVALARTNAVGEVLRYQGPNGPNPGAFVDTYITAGQTGLDIPIGVALDPAGNLYVSQRDTAKVTRYAPTAQATFTIQLNAASASQVSVNYTTANGTATAGGDYVQSSGTLIFAPGETTKTVDVSVVDDLVDEPTESFQLNLSNAVNATIADSQGIGTNLDNETKFYVVDSASTSTQTFEYGSGGTSEEIWFNYASTNTAPRGVATTAAGTTVWVVDANKTVYVYNNGGVLIGSWTPGGLNGNAQLEGIATNGTEVWLLDNSADKVYKYTGAASRLSGSQSAASSFNLVNGKNGNANGKGIVTDGTSIWVVDDGTTDRVFKYTISGSSLGSWTIDAANTHPTGLTINPNSVSDIWIVDNGTLKVYQYTAAAGRTSGSQSAAATFALAAGNTNPQDIADPPTADMLLSTIPDSIALRDQVFAGSPFLADSEMFWENFAADVLTSKEKIVQATGWQS
jgi:WD40 repeat protein